LEAFRLNPFRDVTVVAAIDAEKMRQVGFPKITLRTSYARF